MGDCIFVFGAAIVFLVVVLTNHDVRQWLVPPHSHLPQWHLLLLAALCCPSAIIFFFMAPPFLKACIGALRTERAVASELQMQDPLSPVVERVEVTYEVIPPRSQLWVGLVVGMVMGLGWLFLATTILAVGAFLAFWSGMLPE